MKSGLVSPGCIDQEQQNHPASLSSESVRGKSWTSRHIDAKLSVKQYSGYVFKESVLGRHRRPSRHADAPAAENVPAAHARQAASELAPTAVENLPDMHGVHVVLDSAPTAVEYKPTAHGTHVSLDVAPTAVEKNPAAHGVQVPLVLAPIVAEYEPAKHGVHVVLDAPRDGSESSSG